MILAIGIAAIVLITISSVFFAGLRLRNATQDYVDAATPVNQTLATIKRDLACVVTPTNGTTKVLSGDFRVGNVVSAAFIYDSSVKSQVLKSGVLLQEISETIARQKQEDDGHLRYQMCALIFLIECAMLAVSADNKAPSGFVVSSGKKRQLDELRRRFRCLFFHFYC